MPVWGADAMKMSWLFHADVLSGNAQLMVIAAGYQYGRHGCGEQSCDWHARSYKPLINRGRARRHALPLTLNLCIYKSECKCEPHITTIICLISLCRTSLHRDLILYIIIHIRIPHIISHIFCKTTCPENW